MFHSSYTPQSTAQSVDIFQNICVEVGATKLAGREWYTLMNWPHHERARIGGIQPWSKKVSCLLLIKMSPSQAICACDTISYFSIIHRKWVTRSRCILIRTLITLSSNMDNYSFLLRWLVFASMPCCSPKLVCLWEPRSLLTIENMPHLCQKHLFRGEVICLPKGSTWGRWKMFCSTEWMWSLPPENAFMCFFWR